MLPLWWRYFLPIVIGSSLSVAINRPVYKVVLNSKGYAQFLQYDIDVPPLREFTLCAWVRVTSLESDQSIFTYVGTDDKRIMRLWLDSGGRQLKVSLEHDRVTSRAAVDFAAGAWRDVCVSYQADHGAWALYVDTKLLLCDGSRKLRGYQFPGKGRIIIGYGTSEKGLPTGLSGEIYGASMILFSTIERNNTSNTKPLNRQIKAKNNSPAGHEKENQYIVLGDPQSSEIQSGIPLTINKEYDFISSDLNNPQVANSMTNDFSQFSSNNKKEYDFSIDEKSPSGEKDRKRDYNQAYKNYKRKVNYVKKELTGSSTQDLPIVLDYETPPPMTASISDYSFKTSETAKSASDNHDDDITISDVEKPPSPDYDTKVYGQWTSSKFASNVLSFLKKYNINANKNKKKVMSIYPVGKLSDSYPYPSEFTYTIIRPAINYKKRIHSIKKRHITIRKDKKEYQINLKIIEPTDSDVSYHLKNIDPRLVEVTNRGEAKREIENILHESVDNKPSGEESEEKNNLRISLQKGHLDNIINTSQRHRGRDLMNIIPYLNSKEFFFSNRHIEPIGTTTNQLLLNNAPSSDHHVDQRTSDIHVSNQSKPLPYKLRQDSYGDSIMIGRALAAEVSNQAKQNIYNIPLMKFKHDPITPNSNNIAVTVSEDKNGKDKSIKNHFNRQVKLGNTLNEQFITGFDVNQIRNTFFGGDDAIPDIIKYQSKSNSKLMNIPASNEVRLCENVELHVHEDGSVGKSKIKTPFQPRNIAIEFVVESYKKCSTRESYLTNSPPNIIIIDWTITPVKLFGGAYAKKTKDLCGFF